MPITPNIKPISLFLMAENNPYHRELHCLNCGLHLCDIVGRVVQAVDNIGLSPAQLRHGEIYVEVKCHRSTCHQKYRIFPPQLPSAEVEPTVMLNGVPLTF